MASKRQAQERAARKACLNGDPNKGVAILSELFLDTKNPTFIFNQARCYEQNGRYADAVVRFEEFLRTADVNSSREDRAAAEKHLADCQDKVAKEHSSASTQPPPQPFALPPSTPAPEPASAPASPPATSTVAHNTSAPPPTHGRGLLIAGIATGAVGVAAIAGGVVMALKANSLANQMENDVGGYSTGKESDQKTYKKLSWVGYGVGAACVATGAVLVGFGISSRARTGTSTEFALVPAFGPGHMGAVLKGEF